jgi:hypothetical protein
MTTNLDKTPSDSAVHWDRSSTVQLVCGILTVVLAYQVIANTDSLSLLAAWAVAIALPVTVTISLSIGHGSSIPQSLVQAARFGALSAAVFCLSGWLEWIGPHLRFQDPLSFRFAFEAVVVGVVGDLCIHYDWGALRYARSDNRD